LRVQNGLKKYRSRRRETWTVRGKKWKHGRMTTDVAEAKASRLARYLKEFVGLRSTTIRDVDKYESVLWFSANAYPFTSAEISIL
jgi:hypothetical protein